MFGFNYNNKNKETRFEVLLDEYPKGWGRVTILRDKVTRVQYVYLGSGQGGGLRRF